MNNLKKIRKEHFLTVRELAEKVNINYSTISAIENGRTQFNNDYLKIFTEFFNVSADFLLGLTDIPNRNTKVVPVYDTNKKLLKHLPSLDGNTENRFYILIHHFYSLSDLDFQRDILYLCERTQNINTGDMVFVDRDKKGFFLAYVSNVDNDEIYFNQFDDKNLTINSINALPIYYKNYLSQKYVFNKRDLKILKIISETTKFY